MNEDLRFMKRAKGETESNQLLKRVKRISGQVAGIERMMKERVGCLSVVQQVMAARNALSSLAVELLYREACRTNDKKQLKELLEKLIKEE